ncbi:hypothetical protein [Rhodococcus sovatensis]|uniref:Secreted protein n=1 Tax=Rhodococcus sovatensis TaxID=1805840 RepID=A0ABZ2PFC7_9NOCA
MWWRELAGVAARAVLQIAYRSEHCWAPGTETVCVVMLDWTSVRAKTHRGVSPGRTQTKATAASAVHRLGSAGREDRPDADLDVDDGNDSPVRAMSPEQQLATSTPDVWAWRLAFLVPR